MFPIRDNVPSDTFPLVNYVIILACAVAFLGQLVDVHADGRDALVERYGMIPERVLHPDRPVVREEVVPVRTVLGPGLVRQERRLAEPGFPPWLTLVTSMFLHGGWLHFLGNMWFLFIFGDNVEDRLGHLGYLAFYLLAGLGAGALHLATNAGSSLPTIGASGAIAGVMGAYFLLYPRARVLVVVPIFFLLEFLVLPAALFLGVWFALQLLQGTLTIGSMEAGGVAWWAHIGGFVFGVGAAYRLRRAGWLRGAPVSVDAGRSGFARRAPF